MATMKQIRHDEKAKENDAIVAAAAAAAARKARKPVPPPVAEVYVAPQTDKRSNKDFFQQTADRLKKVVVDNKTAKSKKRK